MSGFPAHVFRGYDVRGLVGREITEELFDLIGRGFASHLWEAQGGPPEVVVGRDLRPSSKRLAEALQHGIAATGASVVDVGEVPTPVANFSYHLLGKDGVAVVTASHNPPQYNGVKLRHAPQHPICGEELQAVRGVIQGNRFRSGQGTVTSADTIQAYVNAIAGRVPAADGFPVAVDPGNGSGSQTTPQALRAMGCDVYELYCEPDGTFPNHHPDPAFPANMRDLQKRVRETGAAVGFAIDGDGDRLGVVDDRGRIIMPDTFVMVLTRQALEQQKGKIVIDVATTDTLAEDIIAHGGEVVRAKCGYPNILQKLSSGREHLLGAEITGHIFFNEADLDFDDATYAACRIASYLANRQTTLSEIIDDPGLKRRAQTPQIRIVTGDSIKEAIAERMADYLAADPRVIRIDRTDGVKAWYEDGWVLVRSSNTAPEVIVRAEGDTEASAGGIAGAVQARVERLMAELTSRPPP